MAGLASAWSQENLPALPYAENALEPYISAKTLSFHHGKHHKAYVDKYNELAAKAGMSSLTLEQAMRKTAGVADQAGLFNNAAQSWNHDFFWKCMKPAGGGVPSGRLLDLINESFGGFEKFKQVFVDAGLGQFGSGWVWLVAEDQELKVVKTANADNPLVRNLRPLLVCDVWEHAYYLDYQNRRKDFLTVFLENLVNWEFAASQLP
ncbi:superoxide dismutase [bacterium]|nr:superoxide dismutase [bacterium]